MRLKLLLLCWFLPTLALSAETPIPSSPTSWLTDSASFMSPQAAQNLDKRLEAFERSSGRQLFVYIGKSTGGVPIEDWSVKAFKAWKVGRKGQDDGVVLFFMVDDQQMRIEVGYGLEGQITDALSSRILNDVIKPRMLAGDRDGAVTAGAEAIVELLEGKTLSTAQHGSSTARINSPLSLWKMLLYGLVGVALLTFFVTHPTLSLYLLINILSGGRGGSGGRNSGGGFSGGGGGRSGGGGASGSW